MPVTLSERIKSEMILSWPSIPLYNSSASSCDWSSSSASAIMNEESKKIVGALPSVFSF